MTKWCPRCERELPRTAFPPNRARHDGVGGYCRDCRTAYNRALEQRLRLACLELLGAECARCLITDRRVLTIDHREGGGTRQRTAGRKQAVFYRHVLAYPDPFQLLRWNCNWLKRLETAGESVYPIPAEVGG